jgi:hypothetical protein
VRIHKKKKNSTVDNKLKKTREVKNSKRAHPGNRTPVSTVGGYYDTTTPDAPFVYSRA